MNPKTRSDQIEADSRKWNLTELIPGLFVVIPLFFIILFGSFANDKTRERAQSCIDRNGERHTTIGVVRRAGSDLFVVSDRWNKLAVVCSGRGRARCLARSPGRAALQNNIGQPATIEFCEDSPVAYTVAGTRYLRWRGMN